MMEQLSCLYVDWATIGTWVGGLATAGAAGWGVYVAKTAWSQERLRRSVNIKTYSILIVSELSHACSAAKSLINNADVILADSEKRIYLRSRLSIETANDLVRSNGDIGEGLATAVAEFVVTVSMLQDSLDRWDAAQNRGDSAMPVVLKIADLVLKKAEKLAKELAVAAVGSRELLDAALARQEGGE